jgi:mannose-1-phosphate guanylyltransferase
VRPIVRFEEKPDAERARLYVLDPNYLWNGGMVLLDPQASSPRRAAWPRP